MMTKEAMIERYDELYNKMASSKDPKNMQIFGESEKWMFRKIASMNPDLAQSWLSHLEAICWHNYLDEKEMNNIAKKIINADGTSGLHWSYDVFTKTVTSLGGAVEDKPYYNSYALCVTANMIYSDLAESIAEDMGYKTVSEVPAEKMAASCYKKAVAYLKDKDGNYLVRDYFRRVMYDSVA